MFKKIDSKTFKTSKGTYKINNEESYLDIFNKQSKGEIILFYRNDRTDRAFTEKSFNKFMKQIDLTLDITKIE